MRSPLNTTAFDEENIVDHKLTSISSDKSFRNFFTQIILSLIEVLVSQSIIFIQLWNHLNVKWKNVFKVE